MDSIYTYLDYRHFLRDWYEDRKTKNSFISYRYIGNKVGLDASFLVKVLQEQTHLSSKSVARFVEFLHLDGKEKEYFELLISYNRAKKASDTKLYFDRLLFLRIPHIKKIDADKYDFFNQWFYTAVYEVLRCYRFNGNYRELAHKLKPSISVTEAKNAVALLERLGFVVQEASGYYSVKDASISTGDRWLSQTINEYQKKMIAMGIEGIDTIPKEDRDISTVSISLSKKTFESICERIQTMRKELLEIASLEQNPEIVYQINFQVFPLSTDGSQKDSSQT